MPKSVEINDEVVAALQELSGCTTRLSKPLNDHVLSPWLRNYHRDKASGIYLPPSVTEQPLRSVSSQGLSNNEIKWSKLKLYPKMDKKHKLWLDAFIERMDGEQEAFDYLNEETDTPPAWLSWWYKEHVHDESA